MTRITDDHEGEKILRVAAFAPYPEEGPSTRYRIVQFREELWAAGVWTDLYPFVQPSDYENLYGDGNLLWKSRLMLGGLRRRLDAVTSVGRYDVVLIHRELAPVLNRSLMWLSARALPAFVFDFDDAIFLPAQGADEIMRHLRSPERDTARFCAEASRVLAGNAYLADYAREARGLGQDDPGVTVLPTVVDTALFAPPANEPAPEEGELPVVGWVGTHSTLGYLESVYPALRELGQHAPFKLRVVSNRPPPFLAGVETEYIRWRPEDEVSYFHGLDIGLYPLSDDPWTRGKCGFKAIQYLACGVPTVASPVGVLPDIVRPGETGELAETREQWVTALEGLLDEPERRRRMGSRGREHIIARYSIPVVMEDLVQALKGAARVNGWAG